MWWRKHRAPDADAEDALFAGLEEARHLTEEGARTRFYRLVDEQECPKCQNALLYLLVPPMAWHETLAMGHRRTRVLPDRHRRYHLRDSQTDSNPPEPRLVP